MSEKMVAQAAADGGNMDQRKRVGKQKLRYSKSILTVGVITLAAVVALAGISYRKTSDRESEEQEAVIMAEAEWSEEEDEDVSEEAEDMTDSTADETIEELTDDPEAADGDRTDDSEAGDDDRTDDVTTDTIEGTVKNAEESSAESVNPVFSESDTLRWPLDGDVILNYSMDQSVYFATLDQYKYNPALIIQGDVNDQVIAAAAGQVVSVETLAETGVTVTMDIGNGYQLVYGQLKEVQADEGDFVDEGDLIGFISEPTKYYSVEGSNLYFEMLKDGEPVNPLDYLE